MLNIYIFIHYIYYSKHNFTVIELNNIFNSFSSTNIFFKIVKKRKKKNAG